MDTEQKPESKARSWGWMKTALPGVARLVVEKRAAFGDAHVNECMRRGLAGEPNWFFAREGAVAIGTPFNTPGTADAWLARQITPTQALLEIRLPGAGDAR